MGNSLKLTSKNVLEEDFEIEYKGYKCEEVDAFLDQIAADYKLFESKINEIQKQNLALKHELDAVNENLEQLKSAVIAKDERLSEFASKGTPMHELIRRVSELENKNANK